MTVQKPTCEGYFCPEGYFCHVIDGQPFCHCHPQCKLLDYLSGPVCTSNLRRFTDRCQLKRAYCDSPNQVFEIVPCLSTEQLFCSRASRLTNAKQMMSWLDNSVTTWRERQRRQPSWTVHRFNDARKRTGALWFDEHQLVSRRAANEYQMDPDFWQILQPRETDASSDELGIGLVCPVGQFCLVRQFDGRPMCTGFLTDRSDDLSDQEPCTREPFPNPKCGVDNRTYVSECEIKLAGLEKQLEIRIAYEGPCVGKTKFQFLLGCEKFLPTETTLSTGPGVALRSFWSISFSKKIKRIRILEHFITMYVVRIYTITCERCSE